MLDLVRFVSGNILHVAPILAVGAFALAIALERTRALYLGYPIGNVAGFFERLKDLVMADRVAEAIALCDRYPGKLVPHVVREALLRAHQPEDLIAGRLEVVLSEAMQKVGRRTPFLATIANVSTLLGLFGTIVGLIHSFEAVGMASAQQRSTLLAAGIATAMNATMMGLGVAIPSMLAFAMLTNKSNRLNAEIEQAASRIMDLIQQRYYAAELDSSAPNAQRS